MSGSLRVHCVCSDKMHRWLKLLRAERLRVPVSCQVATQKPGATYRLRIQCHKICQKSWWINRELCIYAYKVRHIYRQWRWWPLDVWLLHCEASYANYGATGKGARDAIQPWAQNVASGADGTSEWKQRSKRQGTTKSLLNILYFVYDLRLYIWMLPCYLLFPRSL